MIRIAHLADSHLDEKNRLDDNVFVHRAFLEQARDAKVDLIVHSGDFFERRSTPTERNALADFLVGAASIAPVFGVRGNHDVDEDLDVFNRLESEWPISLVDRPTVEPESAVLMSGYGFTSGLKYGAGGDPPRIACLALPWFSKAHLVAQLPADVPAAGSTERTIQLARSMLHALRAEAMRVRAAGAIPILVGHVQVAGCEVSTGQTLIGTTVELAPGDLQDLGCAYVALGHIHCRQGWGSVWYSGSTQRLNFGEPEAKGWNLVTIDPRAGVGPDGEGTEPMIEFVELPARRIVLLECDWTEKIDYASLTRALGGDGAGALVRVRYRIRPEDLHLVEENLIHRELLPAGVHTAKLEPVLVHQDRIRCAEIAAASTTWERILAAVEAKGIEKTPAELERLRAKLERIEREVAHAQAS